MSAAVPPPRADAESPPPLQSERAISPVAGRLGGVSRGRALALGGLIAGCGVFLWATWQDGDRPAERAPIQPARQVVPFEPLRAPPPTLAAPGEAPPRLAGAPETGPQIPAIAPREASPPGAARRGGAAGEAQASKVLVFTRGAAAAVAAGNEAAQPARGPDPNSLEALRQGSKIGRARAARVGDRNFLILAGSAFPCVLQTALESTTPGYVSCLVPRDVYSDNGAVVLMEKGAKVLGEYRASLRQGQARLFVLWTRAVTPSGVAIELASPAADPLGRAGFGGEVDHHFWRRFGGAVLLSVVDDGAAGLFGDGRGDGLARLPSDAAGIALQASVNLPPTLRKAQGAQVSIFVAQDLDFSSVYDLQTR